MEFVDDDLFVVRVPLGEAGIKPADVPVTRSSALVALMRNNPKVTIPQMAKLLGVDAITVKRDLGKLRKDGLICSVGSDKTGRWEVVKIVLEKPASKLSRLRRHKRIRGNPEELVHLDWPEEWKP